MSLLSPDLYRIFLPLGNPLGFSAGDFIVFIAAVLIAAAALLREPILRYARALASKPRLAFAVAALLPVVLRVCLLGGHPIPTPRVADDFSYLLLGDTLAHLRLANPVHPMHRFFEGVFILQEPSYASNFPLGQGLALALGQLLGNPWFGVVLSVAALAGSCYWMLLGWVTPLWALAGGILAGLEFGPLSSWMNTYWGGAVSGIAGCLVFGALPRLSRGRRRDALLLGAGLGLQMLSRPFEFVLLLAGVALFRIPRRALATAALALLPAAGLTLLHNKAVTGNWTELPYVLSRYQYGFPTTFRFQPAPVAHRQLSPEQKVDLEYQTETHDRKPVFGERLRFLRFFFPAPLFLALPFFLRWLREPRFVRVLVVLAILWAGTGFYPYFYPHYIAAAACLFVLISVKSLESLCRFSPQAATAVIVLCVGHFLFWYAIHLTGGNLELALSRIETVNEINTGDPEGRIAVNRRLAAAPGKQLVFVQYFPRHGAMEWIHNAADIDNSRVVWALDLGPDENKLLRRYYPDRMVWLLEADARPPRVMKQ